MASQLHLKRELDAAGLRENRSAAQALDYLDSLQIEQDQKNFLENFKRASRHYVKRQLTWFRHEPIFQWVNLEDFDQELLVDMMIREFL